MKEYRAELGSRSDGCHAAATNRASGRVLTLSRSIRCCLASITEAVPSTSARHCGTGAYV